MKLNGSEKQIKWAERIKEDFISNIESVKAIYINKDPENKKHVEYLTTMFEIIIKKLNQVDDATIFIDNKTTMQYKGVEQTIAMNKALKNAINMKEVNQELKELGL